MSRIADFIEMCKLLTLEDIQTLARNRVLLGELGKEFVPKHFLTCSTCKTPRNDTDKLDYYGTIPKTCDNCMICDICKQPREINTRGLMCLNGNCNASPLKNRQFGRRIDTFGVGFRG
jgi:hypothetical protein